MATPMQRAATPSSTAGASQCRRDASPETSQLRPRSSTATFCTSRNAAAAAPKPIAVAVACSSVPRVTAHTNSTSAGAIAPSTAWRRKASQSAVIATTNVTSTASSNAPSVTGAGGGAVRRSCEPAVEHGRQRLARGAHRDAGDVELGDEGERHEHEERRELEQQRRPRRPAEPAGERAGRVRERDRDEHGHDEAPRREDARERQRRRRGQRGEGEGCEKPRAGDHAILGWVQARFQATGNGVLDASTTTSDDDGDERDRLGEDGDHVDARERGEGAGHVGAHAPQHGDDEVDAAVGADLLEHRDEPVVAIGAHGGEAVEHVMARVAAGPEHGSRRW